MILINIVKFMFTIYLLNLIFVNGLGYVCIAVSNTSEDEIRKMYWRSWRRGFTFLIGLFILAIVWYPNFLQKNFYSNPTPTLVFIFIVSIVLATLGAKSATQSAVSTKTLRKVKSIFLNHEDKK